ncbi:Uncharacterized protein TPAR_03019 [Tolypocladium paradoxum]|uniref:Uncharacterized protein n=1 Tax=Tolypocladium paradoxum TaxID=94208 RepID=A0A2S4L2T4_9HYPO|nr:Uncharacterized protein TPAR_03019 [Tolypocladium paradoxum]
MIAGRNFYAMAALPPRPEQPMVKWPGGFQVVDGAFTVDGVKWKPGTALRLLFYPEDYISCEERLESTRPEAASLLADRPFLAAQLRFYGIAFRPSMTVSELRLLLKTAFDNNLCDAVPYSILDIGPRMQREYKDLLSEWEKKVAAWEALKDNKAAFSKCETPVQRAICDPDLFLEHYFLTDGQPDHSKTPNTPMALVGCTNKYDVLVKAQEIPGLFASIGGHGPQQTIYIGWDEHAVFHLADTVREELDMEQSEKTKEAMKNTNSTGPSC